MEEGKLKRKKISAETTVEILFFLFLLVFYLMWARDDSTVCVASRSQICKHSVWTWNSLAGT